MFVIMQNICKTISLAIGPVTAMFFVELIPFAVKMEQKIVEGKFSWGDLLVCLLKVGLLILSAEAHGNVIIKYNFLFDACYITMFLQCKIYIVSPKILS
jgi:hypothetical protein